MFKFLAKKGLKRSEEEIKNFILLFEEADDEQKGITLGMAAMLNYSLSSADLEFSKLVNSDLGNNQGPISSYILQLNRLVGDFHKAGEYENAAGMKLWNITFRCMTNNAFHHYGQDLWITASKYFDHGKIFLESQIERFESSGNENALEKLKGGLSIFDYIPPQFRNS